MLCVGVDNYICKNSLDFRILKCDVFLFWLNWELEVKKNIIVFKWYIKVMSILLVGLEV